MRAVLALFMIASLAAPAFAQDNHVPRYGEEDKEKTNSQKAADKAAAGGLQAIPRQHPGKGRHRPVGRSALNRSAKAGADQVRQGQGEASRDRRREAIGSSFHGVVGRRPQGTSAQMRSWR